LRLCLPCQTAAISITSPTIRYTTVYVVPTMTSSRVPASRRVQARGTPVQLRNTGAYVKPERGVLVQRSTQKLSKHGIRLALRLCGKLRYAALEFGPLLVNFFVASPSFKTRGIAFTGIPSLARISSARSPPSCFCSNLRTA